MKNSFLTYFFLALSAFLLFFLQVFALNPIPYFKFPVNFLTAFSICVCLFANVSQRWFISIFCGLLMDVWFSSCSFYTLSLLIVNTIVVYLALQTQVSYPFIIISSALGTAMVELINASLLGFCFFNENFNPFTILKDSLPYIASFNIFFNLILFRLLRTFFKVNSLWY